MDRSYTSFLPRDPAPPASDTTLLNRTYAQVSAAKREEDQVQLVREQAEFGMMRGPVSRSKAYRVMGLMLGSLPTAAVLWKFFGYGLFSHNPFIRENPFLAVIFLVLNFACAAIGYAMSGIFLGSSSRSHVGSGTPGGSIHGVEDLSWTGFLFRLPLLGLVWGLVTGAIGGLFIFGPILAIPVGHPGILRVRYFASAIRTPRNDRAAPFFAAGVRYFVNDHGFYPGIALFGISLEAGK